ncbi:hypothetical protein BDN72DRAFT_334299 [Pluteus cervinus]|uniref:Uncharacterized protein n=1 Tax=Pluteus cervinus TaxID=181527 RepID=A0ACD3B2Q0_9AGAR|nr:hypothetical protein BDN72DRAFT_334299 [Pluteus cervinus]
MSMASNPPPTRIPIPIPSPSESLSESSSFSFSFPFSPDFSFFSSSFAFALFFIISSRSDPPLTACLAIHNSFIVSRSFFSNALTFAFSTASSFFVDSNPLRVLSNSASTRSFPGLSSELLPFGTS